MKPSFQVQVIEEAIRVLRIEGQSILACAERRREPNRASPFEKAVAWFDQALQQGGKSWSLGSASRAKSAKR